MTSALSKRNSPIIVLTCTLLIFCASDCAALPFQVVLSEATTFGSIASFDFPICSPLNAGSTKYLQKSCSLSTPQMSSSSHHKMTMMRQSLSASRQTLPCASAQAESYICHFTSKTGWHARHVVFFTMRMIRRIHKPPFR